MAASLRSTRSADTGKPLALGGRNLTQLRDAVHGARHGGFVRRMSGKGRSRRFAGGRCTSALPSIATEQRTSRIGGSVPISDIAPALPFGPNAWRVAHYSATFDDGMPGLVRGW